MPTKKTKSKAGVSGEIMTVLRKVAPFLFKSRKPPASSLQPRNQLAAHKKMAIKKTTKKSLPLKKTSKKPSAKKLAVAAPVAQKKAVAFAVPEVPVVAPKTLKGRFILAPEEQKTDARAVQSALLADAKDDSFLNKVQLKQSAAPGATKAPRFGFALSLLRDRLSFSHSPKKEAQQPEISSKDIAEDSFLQHVEKKNTKSVVGTAGDEEESSNGVLDGFASGSRDDSTPTKSTDAPRGRILSVADLRQETKEAKEAAVRLEKEVQEIKEEMKKQQPASFSKITAAPVKEQEKPKEEVPAEPLRVKKQNVSKSGFQKFVAGIGYIGLGKERMAFIQNLATMLNAGLPLIDAIRTLQLETRPKPMKKLLQRILDAVDNGSPLWRAMEAQSFFTPHALALVRIGEEAGSLSENMEYLAAQEEKDHDLKSKVKMAMIYPSIVMTIMVVVVVILGMFVLPNLIGVLTSLNVELPLVTRIVIAVSHAFTDYGAVGVPGLIIGVFVMMILNKYTKLRAVFQWFTFHIPGVGSLARQATIARFGVILGGLMKAGVPVTEAMQSLVEVTTIVAYRTLYMRMLDHITIGDSFSKSFQAIKGSEKLIPPSVQQLVSTGEKSGALADILIKISEIYDKKASETAQKLPIILEPMLLLFMGGLVGSIAFAILVPIYSIVGNVGR